MNEFGECHCRTKPKKIERGSSRKDVGEKLRQNGRQQKGSMPDRREGGQRKMKKRNEEKRKKRKKRKKKKEKKMQSYALVLLLRVDEAWQTTP